jgi:hypothetical protein
MAENKSAQQGKNKKEKEFDSTKTARRVEKALKEVFPKGKFFVADARPVEVIVKDHNGYTQQEINVFKQVFCSLAKVKQEDLIITLEKVAPVATTPAPTAAAQPATTGAAK